MRREPGNPLPRTAAQTLRLLGAHTSRTRPPFPRCASLCACTPAGHNMQRPDPGPRSRLPAAAST